MNAVVAVDLGFTKVNCSDVAIVCCLVVLDAAKLGFGFVVMLVRLRSDVSPELVAKVDFCSIVCLDNDEKIVLPVVGVVAVKGEEALCSSGELVDCSGRL